MYCISISNENLILMLKKMKMKKIKVVTTVAPYYKSLVVKFIAERKKMSCVDVAVEITVMCARYYTKSYAQVVCLISVLVHA